jgi:hypothetical protein
MQLGLYLAPGLLDRLRQDDPLRRLHDGNLADLCLLIEGVSHFLGVAWHATQERPVTCLELELQAEIDKYVLALLLAARQRRGRVPRGPASDVGVCLAACTAGCSARRGSPRAWRMNRVGATSRPIVLRRTTALRSNAVTCGVAAQPTWCGSCVTSTGSTSATSWA